MSTSPRVLAFAGSLRKDSFNQKLVEVGARGARDAGAEVIYLGMRQTADQIVNAAIQEDADVIGLSILSGIHLNFAHKMVELMREKGLQDVPVVMGGVIPHGDVATLKEMGITEVFPVGSRFDGIVDWIEKNVGNEG